MSKLEIHSIKFGKPDCWHFVMVVYGGAETEIIEDRHKIEVEVMVPSSTKMEKVEEIALNKASTFIKQLAESL